MSTERMGLSLSPNRLSLPRPLEQQCLKQKQLCSVFSFSFSFFSAGAVAFMTAVCNFCANWKLLEVLLSARELYWNVYLTLLSPISLFFFPDGDLRWQSSHAQLRRLGWDYSIGRRRFGALTSSSSSSPAWFITHRWLNLLSSSVTSWIDFPSFCDASSTATFSPRPRLWGIIYRP